MGSIHQLYAELGKVIASATTIDEIVKGIMREVEIYFNPEHWSILRVDDQSNELFFVAIKGTNFEMVKNIRLKVGEGIAGSVVREKHSKFVPDTSKEPNFSTKVDEATGFQTRSIIAVPLIFRDHVFGVIEVVNKLDGNAYSVEDHIVLRTIADFAAIAFYNNKLFEDMKEMAFRDSLTGVYNRAKLHKIIDNRKTTTSHERRKHSAAVSIIFLIDLNNFKKINDSHGHQGGDRVLNNIAARLKGLIREQDYVFRIGGDEFLLLIETEDNPSGAILRISESLKSINIDCLQWKIPYSFCWGMASGPGGDLESVIHKADLDMYTQK